VAPGRYRVAVTQKGFAPILGAAIAVGAGQQILSAPMGMPAGASVSGRMTYADGGPLPLANVQIMKLGYTDDGRPNLVVAQDILTDDLGGYRFFWLAPGSYYLSVNNAQNSVTGQFTVNPLGNGSSYWTGGNGGGKPTAPISRSLGLEEGQSYGKLYYPGTPELERATPLDLAAGAELRNINIVYVPLPTRNPAAIHGAAFDAAGQQPIPGRFVGILHPIDPVGAEQRGVTTLLNGQRGGGNAQQFFPSNGTFDFRNVSPGTYELIATVGDLSGRIVAEVRGSDIDVRVPLYPAVQVSGKLSLDDSSATGSVDWTGMRVRIGGDAAGIPVSANGEFKIANLAAGTYTVEAIIPPSWPDAFVKSIRAQTLELPRGKYSVDGTLPSPLEIVIHRSGGSVDGRVRNERQESIPNASVILVPDQPGPLSPDQFRSATTDETGGFQFHGLPAAGYNIYAWEDIEKNSWFGPGFLQKYSNSKQTIHVGDAQKQTVIVQTAPLN
jgi:hypothetical protein